MHREGGEECAQLGPPRRPPRLAHARHGTSDCRDPSEFEHSDYTHFLVEISTNRTRGNSRSIRSEPEPLRIEPIPDRKADRKRCKPDGEALRATDLTPWRTIDADSGDSLASDISAKSKRPHYVDMARLLEDTVAPPPDSFLTKDIVEEHTPEPARPRRHTTEYRGPAHLALLPLADDDMSSGRDNNHESDCQTVDRRLGKSGSRARMERRGSFRADPGSEASRDNGRPRDGDSPLTRKAALQISAEDMVQMANCGARNKNGSLRHFIGADEDVRSAIARPPRRFSGSEAELADDTAPGKHRIGRKAAPPARERKDEDEMHGRVNRVLTPARKQTSADTDANRVHRVHCAQRGHRTPPGYFLLEDDRPTLRRRSPSAETHRRRKDCDWLPGERSPGMVDSGRPAFRRIGTSSREELAAGVEESFDF